MDVGKEEGRGGDRGSKGARVEASDQMTRKTGRARVDETSCSPSRPVGVT